MILKHLHWLSLSVSLTAGRNLLSKKSATEAGNKAVFFALQAVLFGCGTLLLLCLNICNWMCPSGLTVLYSFIYGILLILSQWMFTLALRKGPTSVCTVLYSFGFVLPTMSGVLFWGEPFEWLNLVGLGIVLLVIALNMQGGSGQARGVKCNSYLPYILVAMFASGGLGIVQKLQQSSPVAIEKSIFLLLAFAFAFCCSFFAFLCCRQKVSLKHSSRICTGLTGLCFAGANFCNTVLSGKMESAVFFPLQNVSAILLTTLFSLILFKERITFRTALILALGVSVIILFSI